MKIIQHINGVVVDILNARQDATADSIALVESIPTYESKEGLNGVLMYGETGLYWAYEVAPASDEISAEEALNIIVGGAEE